MRPIETRYARGDGARIAYRVVGQGSLDLVLVPGFVSNLDILWEDPGYGRLVRRLSAFARLILFDKRGTGLSDRVDPAALPDTAARADDIRAVMDAAGSTRAALLGASDGAALALAFAAASPERVRALALHGGYASAQDVLDPRRARAFLEAVERDWGSGVSLPVLAPSRAEDRRFADWWARLERLSASPTAAVALLRMNAALDVRAALPRIAAPTLVLHRAEDAYVAPAAGRALARAVAGARLAEIAGRDHPLWLGDVDRVADLVEEFLTGTRPVAAGRRALAVILVARLVRPPGHPALRLGAPHADERAALFREAALRIAERSEGAAEWSGPDRIAARFDGPGRALAAAVALRETAASLGLALAQGIHVGEIDLAPAPLSGAPVDLADRIATAARPPDILLSRLAADLVSGSGLQFVDHGGLAVDGGGSLAVVALATERHLEPSIRPVRPTTLGILSPREREVLALVADGTSNTQIAVRLGLSEHTVKRHVANILLKLDLPSRAAAAALVARQPAD